MKHKTLNKIKCAIVGCDLEYTDEYTDNLCRVMQCTRCSTKQVDYGYVGFCMRATQDLHSRLKEK